ncbi:ABC transporter ATP-binding protein [Aerococcus sanguinicola]|uniref:ABC transporter ATP-binding protein n=1 Tax=Aerococcus sanguinicola TaxID=119206 RepID=A0A0X8FC96_9LACT|nr:ABC transporter ATP-binding protein [Aerococcus sanguinicola]AMB94667.1 sugar ABC transporter ATP-binding protein [Aerococcus sanguinicola]PKZ23335.1 ABC transporter ATP-binding protein [Aerococcus sanguinicola]
MLRSLRALLSYLRKESLSLVFILILASLSVACQILIPIQIGEAVNQVVGRGQVHFAGLYRQLAYLLVSAGLAAFFMWGQNRLINQLSYRLMGRLRIDLFKKLQKLPLHFIDQHAHGDLVSRAINDVDLVGSGLVQSFTNFFSGIAMIIGVLVMMLSIHVRTALIVIVLTPLSIAVSSFIANRTYRFFQTQLALRGQLHAYTEELAANQLLVKSFQYEDQAEEDFSQLNQELHESGIWSQFYGALVNPSARVVNSLVYGAVGLYGAFAVVSGQLSVGIFSSFLAYANQYSKPFNDISAVVNEMQTALAANERIFDLLGEEEAGNSYQVAQIPSFKGQLSFDQVAFSYQKDQPLIEDFSLEVQAGQTVAIVGPTGAGKSTLINLLMRFYELDSGRILIDGVDSRQLDKNYLRQLFGMVLQDSWLFEGTIYDNIAYGKPDATYEEVIAASKKACLHPLVEQMDQGYDSPVQVAGANLSSGQQQLICIARILLTNFKMLILDEATSSIDSLTEALVQEAFDQMMQGRTSFVVAHRLSTIQNADVILVLDQGQIVEQGKHEDLLARQGFYYQLYNSQFSHFSKE